MTLLDVDTWNRVKRIFSGAAERSAADRTAYLDRACADDPRLRAEVESLLTAHDRAVLDGDLDSPFLEPGPDPNLGRRLGPWRLTRHLGSGGMGTVYLGIRDEGDFEQRVAVKFVRGVDPGAIRRFRTERRILARLAHPHIARLLDGGRTEDGLPYLVMEYVSGEPITTYCRERNLSLEERLRLFAPVCEAVEFAHHHLVVHRDIKPSNILVTGDGVVKLLDFGIAKLMESEEETRDGLTHTLNRAMTPDYASPEQILGEPVTTLSDVYALGVLLFELLADRAPYRTAELTPRELERLVCDTPPPRVSEAAPPGRKRRLKGDLDTIVASAMHRDPARRPASAREFLADLGRYRSGRPISARADSATYSLRKFVSRNRAGVGIAFALLVVLAGGLAATARQARIAERRLEGGRALANRLLLDVHDGLRDLNGSTRIRRELVANTLAYLDLLAEDSGNDPGLLDDMASAYEKVAALQGNPDEDNLGDLAGAVANYRKAVSIREVLLRDHPGQPRKARDLARAQGRLAVPLSYAGRDSEAMALEASALAVLTPMTRANPADAALARTEARIRAEHGWLQAWEGDPVGPRADLLVAEHRLAALAAGAPDDLDLAVDLWRARYYLGDAYFMGGDLDRSLGWFRTGGNALDSLAARCPGNPRVLRGQMGCAKRLGDVLARKEDSAEALRAYRRALEISERLATNNPENRTAHRGVGFGYNALGAYLVQLGRSDEGIAAIRRAVDIRTALHEADSTNVSDTNDLSISLLRLADAYLSQERYDEAIESCRTARRVHMELPAVERENPQTRGNLAAIEATAGMVLRRSADATREPAVQGARRRESLIHYRAALDLFRRIASGGASTDLWTDDIRVIRGEVDTLEAALSAGDP